jgi:histidine triad (HIT) family protein
MSQPDTCVFCKIIRGQIPCLKIYEDAAVFAFLDIGPLAEGHLLVIPKEHYERLDEMPADGVPALMRPLPRLARAVMQATGADAYNVLTNTGRAASQEVPHMHVHIIPRRSGDGLGYRWLAKKYEAGRGEQLAEQIIQAL